MFEDAWAYDEAEPEQSLSQRGLMLTSADVRAVCEAALLCQSEESVSVMAIELLAARPDVDASDIVTRAIGDSRTSTQDINFLDLIFKYPGIYKSELLPKFLDPDKAPLVRQTAARLVLIGDAFGLRDYVADRYCKETDEIVKINLAAALFRMTGQASFLTFVQQSKRSSVLAVAKEARECESLLIDGSP